MIKVYIAGPYTARTEHGKKHNTDIASLVGAELIHRGFQPFVPHLSHYIDIVSPHEIPYEAWMTLDFELLALCDCLYRLPGHSSGADREVAFAKERGIPVFTTLEAVEAFRDVRQHGPHETSDEVDRLWETDYKQRCQEIMAGDTRRVITPDKYFAAQKLWGTVEQELAASRERLNAIAPEKPLTLAEVAAANGFTYPPKENSGMRDLDTLPDEGEDEECCDDWACDCHEAPVGPSEEQNLQIAYLMQRFAPLFTQGFEITVNEDGSVGMRGKARL